MAEMDSAHPRFQKRRILVATVVGAMGVVNVASAFLSHPSDRLLALRRLVPTELLDSSRTFTLLAGVLLLITGWGLRRGKRRAFVMALLLAAVSVPLNVLKAVDVEEATAAAALMFLLGISAEAFAVRSRAFNWRGFGSRALLAAAGLLVYAVAGCWWLEARYGPTASAGRALAEAFYRLVGIGGPSLQFDPGEAHRAERLITWYLDSLPLLGGALLAGLALLSFRPALHRRRHSSESRRVAEILHRFGDSTVASFALDDDIDYFFSETGRAVIAYRFESDVLLVIGDPVGPAEELPPLLDRFERWCRDNDWHFAFFQARPEYRAMYEARGWRLLHIGEDAILFPGRFSLEGSAIGDVRRSTRKAEEAGLEIRSWRPGVDPFDRGHDPDGFDAQLREVSAEWLAHHAGGEKGFCMGRFESVRLDQHWLMAAWNPAARRIEAFISWVPIWARHGWALDLTRRRSDAAHGVMEFLIVRSVEEARRHGDEVMSLALSALAMVDEPGLPLPGAAPSAFGATPAPPAPAAPTPADEPGGGGPVDRTLSARAREMLRRRLDPEEAREYLRVHLARFYDFKGLFRWKKKFNPTFEDRFLVYVSPLDLPRVTVALLRAQTAGGLRDYVRWPGPGG